MGPVSGGYARRQRTSSRYTIGGLIVLAVLALGCFLCGFASAIIGLG